MRNSIRMKRHESFSIREGWLVKGLFAVFNDPLVFSSKDATDILGIGTNMVKSLKYWMIATRIVEEKNRGIYLTNFGELIKKYDPYLENIFTWWLIHINLCLNLDDAFVINMFFNKINKSFSKKDVFDVLSYNFDTLNLSFNDKILQDEINVIIKTYVYEEKVDDPESSLLCPLSELMLLKKVDREHYEKVKPKSGNLNYLVVYYLLMNIMKDTDSISLEELLRIDNSFTKIINLDKSMVYDYLDEMKRKHLLTINRTAGLNMIYLDKRSDLKQIFRSYFG